MFVVHIFIYASYMLRFQEASFNQMFRQCATDERQNQLRWQTKLGSKPMTQSHRNQILADRLECSFEYQVGFIGQFA